MRAVMMDEARGRGWSLAGAGQVINCEITQERPQSSVQTDLLPRRTRNKS